MDDGHGVRHIFTTAATAAMSIILAATVIGSAAVWRNQAIIQATRFTNTDGAMLVQAQSELRLYMASFQTEVLRIISDLPSDDWEQRILNLEQHVQDLRLEIARVTREEDNGNGQQN